MKLKKANKTNKEVFIAFMLGLFILFSYYLLINKTGITGLAVYDEIVTKEAEDLEIIGTYEVSDYCVCSSPSNLCVKHNGSVGETGSIKYNFDLEDGLYDIAMRHCPENNGNDTYKLYVNGELIETFEEISDSEVWEEYIFDSIDLNQGDEVKISCTRPPGSTYCRIDQVIFKKITQVVNINETIEDAEEIPINSTILWKQGGEVVQESSGETHEYELEQGDYELEIVPEHSSIKKIELDKTITNDVEDIVDVDEDPTPDTEYSQTYAIDPKDPEIEDAIVTITATGTELFKCQDWDFDNRECDGSWVKLMDTVPGQEYSFPVDCGYKEKGGCSCKGVRYVDLFSDYTFNNGSSYSVTVEVFKGSNTNPSNLLDSESIIFNSVPQYSVDSSPGHSEYGNLIIEQINSSGILIKMHNASKGKLKSDNTFRITINSSVLGPDTIHLSCSQPIGIGDVFGDFEVVDIDKKLSGSDCPLPAINLISPADDSLFNISNVSFEYSVYDPSQDISFCELIIDYSVYQTDYSITEGVSQYFNQILPNGTYEWHIDCTTSNGYKASSETRILHIGSLGDICKINVESAFYDKICDDVYNLTLELVFPINQTTEVRVFSSSGDCDNHEGNGIFEDTDDHCNEYDESHVITPTNKTFTSGSYGSDTTFVVMNTSYWEKIHTSCSRPIGPGMIFDEFKIIDWDYKPKSGTNFTSKVITKDGVYADVDKGKWFGVAFEKELTNNDIISMYILEKDDSNVYLCDYSEKNCDFPGYGSVYTDLEGWYNITISNLTQATDSFNIDPHVWFDYIFALNHSCFLENNVKGVITDSNNNPVDSEVKVYNSNGDLVLTDDEIYDFNLPNGIYDVQVKPTSGNFNELYIHNLTVDSNIVNFTRLEDSPEYNFGEFFENLTEVISWKINPLATYDKVSINLSYDNGSDLVLWKCTDFDFDNQTCLNEDNWTIIQNVSDGPDEVVFDLSANDPVAAVAGGDKPPIVTLNYPPDNFVVNTSTSYPITFNCSAEDKQGSNKGITNISLYITNNQNTSFSLNETIIFSGTNKEETALFNKTLSIGNYTWNCLAYDNGGNYDWDDNNRSIQIIAFAVNDTTVPIVTSISPANNSVDDDGYVVFQYNVTDNESNIDYCELVINGSIVDTDYSITKDVTQSFNKVLTNGTYSWSVNCTNDFNLTGSSEIRVLIVNITEVIGNVTGCCCGLSVSSTPEVVSQGEKVLVTADVSNLFTGLAAIPADVIDVNATIYRVENGSDTVVVSNIPMTYLADGLWYYEFYVGNNDTGTYIASVTMLTNQTTPFVKEASDSFTVGETSSGLTILGVSPDLININETARIAAEIKNNGVAVDQSLILNASVIVEMINGANQTYNTSNGLQVEDGIIYVDGAFNETGIYYLDWSATYLGETRTAREIVVVVGWEELLEDINETVNVELLDLIKESRQYLLELLNNMEYLQQFNEEEVFLITDSVNSMTKVVEYLENGEMTNEQAEQQFNSIRQELMNKLGDRITASAIGLGAEAQEAKQSRLSERLKDWKSIMFAILLLIFTSIMIIIIVLVKMRQGGIPSYQGSIKQTKGKANLGKRRYEILIDKIRQRRQKRLEEIKKRNKEQEIPHLIPKRDGIIKNEKAIEWENVKYEGTEIEKEREIEKELKRVKQEKARLDREKERGLEREWKRIEQEKIRLDREKERGLERELKRVKQEKARLDREKKKRK